jgi:hypothetical protein
MPISCVALMPVVQQQGDDLHRLALASLSSPIRQFFPRKLSPRTAGDDPLVLS